MIRVGLSFVQKDYRATPPPFDPPQAYPELQTLFSGSITQNRDNETYAAVRAALYGLGLDREHFGTAHWNPIGALVSRGKKIVLKPNFIRHWNPEARGTLFSVITHGSILRAVLDYAFLAVGPEGSVTIAEAPQQDCDFEKIRSLVGLDALERFYRERLGRKLRIIDLRREAVIYQDAIIISRKALPGDPAGYRDIDLGEKSCFAQAADIDPQRFRGADYDASVTTKHHTGGKHAYLLSETVLSADLVINLPKLKTHKKTGVTLALKNLVGINGDKNRLPHHSVGSTADGGDEFPERKLIDRVRSQLTEIARPFLKRGIATSVFRFYRRVESATRGTTFIRSGNWYGNRTTWRMCIDLNRCLYYSNAQGNFFDAKTPVRTVLTILDGIIAGEGEGPLAPVDVPLGAVLAATDPVAIDIAAVRLMGFDEKKISKIYEAMRADTLRVTQVRDASEIRVAEVATPDFQLREIAPDQIVCQHIFEPHCGWTEHIERVAPGAKA